MKACGAFILTGTLRCALRFDCGLANLKLDPKNNKKWGQFYMFWALKVIFWNLTSDALTQN